MTDEQRDDKRVGQQDVDRLHRGIPDLLNEPSAKWAEQPMVAAGAIASALGNILVFIVSHDPSRLAWVSQLLGDIADVVGQAAAAAKASAKRQH